MICDNLIIENKMGTDWTYPEKAQYKKNPLTAILREVGEGSAQGIGRKEQYNKRL